MLKPKFKAKRLTINVSIIKFTIIIELNARKGLKLTLQVINNKIYSTQGRINTHVALVIKCLSETRFG